MLIQPITSLHRIHSILLASIAIALICLKNSALKLLQMADQLQAQQKNNHVMNFVYRPERSVTVTLLMDSGLWSC
jgi:hypothetical protein